MCRKLAVNVMPGILAPFLQQIRHAKIATSYYRVLVNYVEIHKTAYQITVSIEYAHQNQKNVRTTVIVTSVIAILSRVVVSFTISMGLRFLDAQQKTLIVLPAANVLLDISVKIVH
jgi:hypothetical protein